MIRSAKWAYSAFQAHVSRSAMRGLLRWSRGSMGRRGVAVVVVAAAVAVLAWAWWPAPDNYRPIQPGERGLLTAVLQSRSTAAGDHVDPHPSSAGRAARTRLSSGRPMVAAFPRDRDLPTREQPTLALVLVPTQSGPGSTSGSGSTTAGDSAEPWVFPFDQPLPPEAGDNQALAVATRDGEVTYDVAFALVWADGDQVLNVNEAHAYASCSDCVAVAVAFQVVLILDDAQVVVPQNLAVAANYDCHRCITAAVASQLVLSLDAPPGQEELRQLAEVWNRLLEFANTITSYSLEEITSQLEAFKSEILAILGQAPPVETAPTTTTPTTSTQPTSTSTQTTATATQTPTVEEPSETPPSPTTSSPSTTSPTSPTSSPTGDATPTSGSTAPEATPTTAPTSTASP
jgi:putative peptide zinc metalloprotease protein